MRAIGGILLFAMSFFALTATAAGKKTLCTMTFNSLQEREVFRKHLPTSEWNHIELVPSEKPSADDEVTADGDLPKWLLSACEIKTKCDVLVISGHFGESYVGDSGYELSMDQMEIANCAQKCDGIFKKPKEVFLFGCNTLAGKAEDRRSPEEYLEALLQSGYPRGQAEQTVAIRYSPWGDEYLDRARDIFSGSAKIYGFDSLGPYGSTNYGYLKKYFQAMPKNYSSYLDGLKKDSPVNAAFAKAFRLTTLVETSGLTSPVTSAACFLRNPKVHQDHKILFVKNALNGPNALQLAPTIAAWVKKARMLGWSDRSMKLWRQLEGDQSLRDRFLTLSEQIFDLPVVKHKLYRFAADMRWLTIGDFFSKRLKIVAAFFADGKIERDERQSLCYMAKDERIVLDYRAMGLKGMDLQAALALTCFGTVNDEILEAIADELDSKDLQTKVDARHALADIYNRGTLHSIKSETRLRSLTSASYLDDRYRGYVYAILAKRGFIRESEWRAFVRELESTRKPSDFMGDVMVGASEIPRFVFDAVFKSIATDFSDYSFDDNSRSTMGWMFYLCGKPHIKDEWIVDQLLIHENNPFYSYLIKNFAASTRSSWSRKKILEQVLKFSKNENARRLARELRAEIK